MTRLPVSSLLVASVGAALTFTAACGDSGGGGNTGGSSGTGPSTGGSNMPQAGTPSTSGSAGQATGGGTTGGTGGAGAMGGSAGSPPATGGTTGGANPMGGTAGTGVVAGMGGTGAGGSAAGGSAGMPPGGNGGTGNTTQCMVNGDAVQAENIGTVFNVAVTTDLAGFSGGQVDFGIDTNYGFSAPIDMAKSSAMLLGMKQNTDYHYRVTVKAGDMTCVGTDKTLTTGGLLTGFPKATISPAMTPATSAGGFMISEFYAGQRQVPFILDKDLDLVWTYDWKIGQPTRARMSPDGKWMWVARANVPSQNAGMKKIAMDGSSEQDLSAKFPRMNHDFTILNDEHQTMYFIAYAQSGSCDDIVEYDPVTDMTKVVMNTSKAFSDGAACHCNAIDYSPSDDSIIFSDLDHHALAKVDRKTWTTKWVLNGCEENDFTGEGSTWTGPEHNFHILDKDHILLFNNVVGMGVGGSCPVGNSGSLAIELKLDEGAKTATKMWSYASMPAIQNIVMGDVQRLMPSGNTVVAYSTQGVVHEVDPMGALIRSISWGTGGAIGYIIMRPTLYGPSPR